MPDGISVGSVSVDIVPSAKSFATDLRRQIVPSATQVGEEAGRSIADRINSNLRGINDVRIGADTRQVIDQVGKAKAAVDRTTGKLKITADDPINAAWRSKIQASLKATANEALKIPISPETEKFHRDLAATLDFISHEGLDVKIPADVDKAAEFKSEVQLLAHLASEEVKVRIPVEADTSSLDNLSKRLKGASQNAGLMSTAIISLAPAAVPVLAAVTAGAVAMGGALAGAGLGAGALALVAVPAFKDVSIATKAVTAAQKQMAAAQLRLDTAKTTAQKASAHRSMAQALLAEKQAMANLTPAEKDLALALTNTKAVFEKWQNALQPTVLPLFTKALSLVKPALNSITPLVKGAAAGFGAFLSEVKVVVGSPAWNQMMTMFGQFAKDAIPKFGDALLNLGQAFGNLFRAFKPVTDQMLTGLVNLTTRFEAWSSTLGQSAGFHQFINYVQTNGPKLVHLVGEIATAFVAIVRDIAPLGPIYLDVISKTVQMVTEFVKAHPKIVEWGIALAGAVKVLSLFKTPAANVISVVSNLNKAFTGKEGAAGWAKGIASAAGGVGNFIKSAAGMPTLLGLLAAGIGTLAVKSYQWTTAAEGNVKTIVDSKVGYNQAAVALSQNYTKALIQARDAAKQNIGVQGAMGDGAANLALITSTSAQKVGVATNNVLTGTRKVADMYGVSLPQAYAAAKRAGIELTAGFQGDSKAAQDNRTKLDGLRQALMLTQNPTSQVAGAIQILNDKTQTASTKIQTLSGLLDTLMGKNVGAAQSELHFRDTVGNLTTSVQTNGRSLDINTQAGRTNRQAVLDSVQAAQDHAQAVYKQTGNIDLSRQALIHDLSALQQNADKTYGNKGAVDGLLGSLGALPSQAADATKAMGAFANDTNRVLQQIGDKTLTVNAYGTFFERWSDPSGNIHVQRSTMHADGGYIAGPGTSTSDSIPAYLSNGEYVINAASTAKTLPLLEAINAGKFASGGQAGETARYAGGGIVLKDVINPGNLYSSPSPWYESVIKQYEKLLASQIAAQRAASSGTGDSGARSASAALAQSYAASALGRYGWGAGQMTPLVKLWNQESGWNAYAVNPSSGAYGIPQSLGHGHPYNLGDYVTQINWGLNYIAGRYGSPSGAWAHEMANNWYDNGGLATGIGAMMKNTLAPERVLSPAQTASFDRLVSVLDSGAAGGGGVTNNVQINAATASPTQIATETIRRLSFEMR